MGRVLLKMDEAWKILSAASLQTSPFPIAMGGRSCLAHCGPSNRPCWFFSATMAEFFAASTPRSCANTSKSSGTKEPLLPRSDWATPVTRASSAKKRASPSSSDRRNPPGLSRGGLEVRESLASLAERERRGKKARPCRRPSSAQVRAESISARRKLCVRSGECGPVCPHQPDVWRQCHCRRVVASAAVDGTAGHLTQPPRPWQTQKQLLIKYSREEISLHRKLARTDLCVRRGSVQRRANQTGRRKSSAGLPG